MFPFLLQFNVKDRKNDFKNICRNIFREKKCFVCFFFKCQTEIITCITYILFTVLEALKSTMRCDETKSFAHMWKYALYNKVIPTNTSNDDVR